MQAHARHLTRLGADVTVCSVADTFSQQDLPSWEPITPKFFAPTYRRFGYAPDLANELLASNFEIVHQHGLWLYPSIAVSRWRRRYRRPVVISTQGMLEPWAINNSRPKKALATCLFERRNLQQASCLHCSPAEVEGIRRFGLRTPIAVLPNGADLAHKHVRRDRPEWLPDDGRRTLLFLGRLHPKKGIRETLDAWAILKESAPELARRWRLVVAGWDDGGHAEFLTAHARVNGLSKDVIFPGPLFNEAKDAVLAYADAFILASYSEGSPIAVLEAWSFALPVFMTRQCNLAEGFAAKAAVEITSDPRELSTTLIRHLESSELDQIGIRGRELLLHKFSWSAIGSDLLNVYKWLAYDCDRPACVVAP